MVENCLGTFENSHCWIRSVPFSSISFCVDFQPVGYFFFFLMERRGRDSVERKPTITFKIQNPQDGWFLWKFSGPNHSRISTIILNRRPNMAPGSRSTIIHRPNFHVPGLKVTDLGQILVYLIAFSRLQLFLLQFWHLRCKSTAQNSTCINQTRAVDMYHVISTFVIYFTCCLGPPDIKTCFFIPIKCRPWYFKW